MKVGRIQHKINLESDLPKGANVDCDECDNRAKYEIMYDEVGNVVKSRLTYLCQDCESDMEEVK